MTGLRVVNPGLLSLLQDGGRIGYHGIGLTTGGPLSREAFNWANLLLGNQPGACALEVSFGGLELEALVTTQVAVTGAENKVAVNDEATDMWRGITLRPGDRLRLDFCTAGCRNYVAVADGFEVQPVFGSCSTVVREGLGGLNGAKVGRDQILPCGESTERTLLQLPNENRPCYSDEATVRVVPGYQFEQFSKISRQLFFASEYIVSEAADRMGYRLEGPAIPSATRTMLSEGICLGAIQVPADGQPIVLLNDRQTIGGYPKLGSVLSLDCDRLSQLRPGGVVRFRPISGLDAHNELHLAAARSKTIALQELSP